MKHRNANKRSNGLTWEQVLIAVLIALFFIVIIVYLIKDASRDKKEELNRDKNNLLKERNRLKQQILNKEIELQAAESKYRRVYPAIRMFITLLWALILILMHNAWCAIENIGDFVDFNSILLLAILVLNYLLYGEIFDLKELNGQIKERIKNFCFKGNLHLEQDIYQYNKELDKIELRLEAVERELKQNDCPFFTPKLC